MALTALQKKISKKEATLAVIGLGYVGLPVACTFAKAGFDVIGIDIQKSRIDLINAGKSPIEGNEPGLAELLADVVASKKLRASLNYDDLRTVDIVLIAVETPVDGENKPRYEALRAVLKSLGPVLMTGALVIVESTIAPGTMGKLVAPLLEESSHKKAGEGFYLGNCPERVMPGKLLNNLKTVNRVVGGMTLETSEVMVDLYRHIISDADLDPTDCVTAELVKTAENAYRDVQIAFANEVALVSEAVGGDAWKVRELVNKSPGRHMLFPGSGVGGHCIPKDPWLLASAVEGTDIKLRLIPAARRVNDDMPVHIMNLLEAQLKNQGKELKGSKILILGYSYLEDSDDFRNSPSEVLVKHLEASGVRVEVHDPYVTKFNGDVFEKARNSTAIVLMVKHSEYRQLHLDRLASVMGTAILVDGRGFFDPQLAMEAGFIFRSIGRGNSD